MAAPMPHCSDRPGGLPGDHDRQRHPRRPAPWIAPWRSLTPWWVMLAGVVLGQWIGFPPLLFVAMAAVCLLLSCLLEG